MPIDDNLDHIQARLAPGQSAVVLLTKATDGEVFCITALPCRSRRLALGGALNTLIETFNRASLVREIPVLIEEGE